jgi:uncharacterized protein YbaR (Trm112 family)
MKIDGKLPDIWACPHCKSRIFLNESKDGFICSVCGLFYRIEDNIPVMLVDEAIKIN